MKANWRNTEATAGLHFEETFHYCPRCWHQIHRQEADFVGSVDAVVVEPHIEVVSMRFPGMGVFQEWGQTNFLRALLEAKPGF